MSSSEYDSFPIVHQKLAAATGHSQAVSHTSASSRHTGRHECDPMAAAETANVCAFCLSSEGDPFTLPLIQMVS